jgi:hypothetical protein
MVTIARVTGYCDGVRGEAFLVHLMWKTYLMAVDGMFTTFLQNIVLKTIDNPKIW